MKGAAQFIWSGNHLKYFWSFLSYFVMDSIHIKVRRNFKKGACHFVYNRDSLEEKLVLALTFFCNMSLQQYDFLIIEGNLCEFSLIIQDKILREDI